MMASDIVWSPDLPPMLRACPVCGCPGPHAPRLEITDSGGTPQRLLGCGTCTTLFYETEAAFDYAADEHPLLNRLYLEQNADIFGMTRPLFTLELPVPPSLLDVGCGFGFPVMLAQSVLHWRACGLDPKPALPLPGVDIRQGYLTAATDLGAPYGLIIASEVIEHLADPHAFLRLLRRHLVTDGVLALTTPNGHRVAPDGPYGEVRQILAPGGHLVIFTPQALEGCLRQAGFSHVQVEARGAGLLAVASDSPFRFRADGEHAHREAYALFLQALMARAEPGSALWNGAAQRLLRILPQDDAIHALFEVIAAVWRANLGFDISAPERLADLPPNVTLPPIPFCLASVLMARGMLERRLDNRDRLRELSWLRQASLCAVRARTALLGARLEDLDLRQTSWIAKLELARSLAELIPEMEGDLLGSLGRPSIPGQQAHDLPAAFLIAETAGRFIALVHAGAYQAAQRFAHLFADLGLVCETLSDRPHLLFHTLFCSAMLQLNGFGDAAAAAPPLLRLRDATMDRTTRMRDPDLAQHFHALALAHLPQPQA